MPGVSLLEAERKLGMKNKVLYILPNLNIFGGTPKKTLDLMRRLKDQSVLYVYTDSYIENKYRFLESGGSVYEGLYGRNILKHARKLAEIIDKENVKIVQTQFFMGELLGSLLKLFRPKIRLVVAFVGAVDNSKPKILVSSFLYNFVDTFVYISKYVELEKKKLYPVLYKKDGRIILNGACPRNDVAALDVKLKSVSLLAVSGLSKIKNVEVLISAVNIIVNKKKEKEIYLYVVGDGPERSSLQKLVSKYNLTNNVFLLGYQHAVGQLLRECDIFVHPCYCEGFGIAVAEAMFHKKPIIVASAGALTELIEHDRSGLVADPHSAANWADSILEMAYDREKASSLAINALERARTNFTLDRFLKDYEKLYDEIAFHKL